MGILLVRHAQAVPEQGGMDDAVRFLTAVGRAQAREVAEAVRAKGFVPTRLLVSPRVRAVQTGELLAQGLGFSGVVETLASLSYTVPAVRAAQELSAYAGEATLAVGHMPTLAEIAAKLTSGSHQAGLSLCEALWIEDGHVVWSVSPR